MPSIGDTRRRRISSVEGLRSGVAEGASAEKRTRHEAACLGNSKVKEEYSLPSCSARVNGSAAGVCMARRTDADFFAPMHMAEGRITLQASARELVRQALVFKAVLRKCRHHAGYAREARVYIPRRQA